VFELAKKGGVWQLQSSCDYVVRRTQLGLSRCIRLAGSQAHLHAQRAGVHKNKKKGGSCESGSCGRVATAPRLTRSQAEAAPPAG
jgi:hypothetical protein